MRTGTYFQFARGRAIVRSRALRLARIALNRVKGGDTSSQQAYEFEVWRARHAHREWRYWRRLHEQYER